MDWAQIIVTLLVICLSLFIIVIIALVVTVLRLTVQIRSLMRSAEQVIENVSQAATSAGAMTRLVALVGAMAKKIKRNKRES